MHTAVRDFGSTLRATAWSAKRSTRQSIGSTLAGNFAYIPRGVPSAPLFGVFETSAICGHMSAGSLIELVHALDQVVFDGRQRPLQFSEDCGGFDFLGTYVSRAGICLLDGQVEPDPHFALFPGKSKRTGILRCGSPWDQGHVCRVSAGRYAPPVHPSHLPTSPYRQSAKPRQLVYRRIGKPPGFYACIVMKEPISIGLSFPDPEGRIKPLEHSSTFKTC